MAPATEETRYRIRAHRSRASTLGAASAWAKDADGEPYEFATKEEAQDKVDAWHERQSITSAVGYVVVPVTPDGRPVR